MNKNDIDDKGIRNHEPLVTVITALLSFDDKIIETFHSLKKDLSSNSLRWIIKCAEKPTEQQLLKFKECQNQIFFYYKKDESLYEGLNQALLLVKTDYFLVLGSGDTLLPEAVNLINNKIEENPEADGVFFSVNYENYIYSTQLDSIHFRMPCSHQGAVLKTKKAILIGSFDLKYKYASDYDLLCRYCLKYPNIICSNFVIGSNKPDGLSEKNKFETVLELYIIGHKFWKDKYKEFEFNDIIINNLNFVQKQAKLKKLKKDKGEHMQSPSELRQEIFSHILKIENERKNEESKRYKNIFTQINNLSLAVSDLSKAISIANEEFEIMKSQNYQSLNNEQFIKQKMPITQSSPIKKINNYIKYPKSSDAQESRSSDAQKLKEFFGID